MGPTMSRFDLLETLDLGEVCFFMTLGAFEGDPNAEDEECESEDRKEEDRDAQIFPVNPKIVKKGYSASNEAPLAEWWHCKMISRTDLHGMQ